MKITELKIEGTELPVAETNASALASGLLVGDLYRTLAGEVRVVVAG